MREIKFRAWDINRKSMSPPFKLDVIFASMGATDTPKTEFSVQEAFEAQQIITRFMQYTGLKDKNGKEIYEGDIFRIILSDGSHLDKVVKWIDEKARFCCANIPEIPNEKYWDIWNDMRQEWINKRDNFEVIGNIHENPELLIS